MRIKIVAHGVLKEAPLRELTDGYLARVSRYCGCEEIELKAGRTSAAAAYRKATAEAQVIALDEQGEHLSSPQFARQLERHASHGKGVVAFLIGGADGLPKETLSGAHAIWSLSALTFPHRLARLVLAEQLYRALSILRGEPYDRR